MYCIKCGVELADSEKVCPLCGTRVYHPDIEIKTTEPPFPEYKLREPRMNLRGIMFIVTMIFAALIVQLVICNISISNASEWSGYAIGAVLLLYELVALPLWFKRPNPVIFVPCGFAAVLAFCFLSTLLFTEGGSSSLHSPLSVHTDCSLRRL